MSSEEIVTTADNPAAEETGESRIESREQATDTKAHLTNSVPRAATVPRGVMSAAELREARELFGNLTDSEIHRLYKKVTQ